jgi:hypothetical protein
VWTRVYFIVMIAIWLAAAWFLLFGPKPIIFDLAVLVPPLDERGSLLWEPRPEMQFGRPIVVFNDIDLGTKCLTNRTVLAK